MGFNFFTHFYLVKTLKFLTALFGDQCQCNNAPQCERRSKLHN
ncbi:hypothetical protein CF65_01987 [Aggregatibacter actinomycetemcomitans HK1651]|nr:hypothetical protein CF65_01987 [Aggregatibacter actinomycetemcomitans HK1651]